MSHFANLLLSCRGSSPRSLHEELPDKARILDWLVRAELDPTSDGNFSLASLYQADAGGDRVPRGGERETCSESSLLGNVGCANLLLNFAGTQVVHLVSCKTRSLKNPFEGAC